MDCRIVVNSLSNYLDGSLLENEIRLIEIHLSECPPCNTVRLDLSEIRKAARELPLHTPSHALWQRIQSRLEAETPPGGAARERVEEPGWWTRLMARRFTVTLPQLAGVGALAVILVAFSLVNVMRRVGQPLNFAGGTGQGFTQVTAAAVLPGEHEKRADIERRMSVLSTRKATWDPQMRELFESNLTKIDESLNHCRQDLLAHPSDRDHQQLILALYDEKLRLLDDFDKLK